MVGRSSEEAKTEIVGDLGVLDAGREWEFDQVEHICTEVGIGVVADLYLPVLRVQSNYGDWITVPLYGPIAFQLSDGWYCKRCFKEIEGRMQEGLCEACWSWQNALFSRGPCDSIGEELQERFQLPNKFLDKMRYLLYLGVFGALMYVGSVPRNEVKAQLLQQGVDIALTFTRGEGDFSLEQARAYEQLLRAEYNFDESVLISELLNLEGIQGHAIEKLQRLGSTIAKQYGFKRDATFNLWRNYFNMPRCPRLYELRQGWLEGRVVGAKGRVLFLVCPEGDYVFDLKEFIGRKILNVRS